MLGDLVAISIPPMLGTPRQQGLCSHFDSSLLGNMLSGCPTRSWVVRGAPG